MTAGIYVFLQVTFHHSYKKIVIMYLAHFSNLQKKRNNTFVVLDKFLFTNE